MNQLKGRGHARAALPSRALGWRPFPFGAVSVAIPVGIESSHVPLFVGRSSHLVCFESVHSIFLPLLPLVCGINANVVCGHCCVKLTGCLDENVFCRGY